MIAAPDVLPLVVEALGYGLAVVGLSLVLRGTGICLIEPLAVGLMVAWSVCAGREGTPILPALLVAALLASTMPISLRVYSYLRHFKAGSTVSLLSSFCLSQAAIAIADKLENGRIAGGRLLSDSCSAVVGLLALAGIAAVWATRVDWITLVQLACDSDEILYSLGRSKRRIRTACLVACIALTCLGIQLVAGSRDSLGLGTFREVFLVSLALLYFLRFSPPYSAVLAATGVVALRDLLLLWGLQAAPEVAYCLALLVLVLLRAFGLGMVSRPPKQPPASGSTVLGPAQVQGPPS